MPQLPVNIGGYVTDTSQWGVMVVTDSICTLSAQGWTRPRLRLGTTGTYAACLDPDDDECLWTGHDIVQKRSEWEGCGDGAQASESERLTMIFLIGSLWESVGAADQI